MSYEQAFLDYYDELDAEKERRELEERDNRQWRKAANHYQRREDKMLKDISEPSLERALDRAAAGLTKRRMQDLEVKIGETLATQVKEGVRGAFNEMNQRGHRAYMQEDFGSRDYVQSITIQLEPVAYRIYQRRGSWEWVG